MVIMYRSQLCIAVDTIDRFPLENLCLAGK